MLLFKLGVPLRQTLSRATPVVRYYGQFAKELPKNILPKTSRHYSSQQRLDNLDRNIEVFKKLEMIEKLKVSGKYYYKNYVPFGVKAGSGLGLFCSFGLIGDDLNNENRNWKDKISLISFPIMGIVAGGFLGATAPIWILCPPVGPVFGYATIKIVVLIAGIFAFVLDSFEE